MTNALKRRVAKLEGAAGPALTDEELLKLSPSDRLLYHMRRDGLLSLLKGLGPPKAYVEKYGKDGGETGGGK